MKKNEIVLFESKDGKVSLPVSVDVDTVWLSRMQMAELFGVTPQNTYLFIRGHSIQDLIINKVLTPICTSLISEREQEIYKYAVHTEQLNNEISSYRHSQMSIHDAIRKNTHYRECELYSRMRSDVQHLLDMSESEVLSVLPECGCEENQNSK